MPTTSRQKVWRPCTAASTYFEVARRLRHKWEQLYSQKTRGHEAREAVRLPRGRPCELDTDDVISRSKGPRAGSCRGEHLRRLPVHQEVQ